MKAIMSSLSERRSSGCIINRLLSQKRRGENREVCGFRVCLKRTRRNTHDLAHNLSWTSSLGGAFTNQQAEVMAAVKTMRSKAQAAGPLQSSSQITSFARQPL